MKLAFTGVVTTQTKVNYTIRENRELAS